jgi:hypothetical protein
MRRALPLLMLLGLPATATPTWAAGQGETALTAGPGLAVGLTGATRVGASLDARLLYGLTDAWSARLGIAGVWLPSSSGESGAGRIVAPTLGVTVAADVLSLVPFAEAGIVFGDARGGGLAARQYLGGQLGAGLDYWVTRRLTVTLLGRIDYLALHVAGPDEAKPLLVSFALHLGYAFGP